MPQREASEADYSPPGVALTRRGRPADIAVPAFPPMRVVTKGWWILREEDVPIDDLEQN